MKKISLIPFVCGVGASVAGAEQGPLYAHAHGLDKKLRSEMIDYQWVIDPELRWEDKHGKEAHHELTPQGSAERLETALWHVRCLATDVATELRKGRQVITIGGDHTLSAGSLAGAQAAFGADARIGLIWIDAHPDIHTLRSSISKALHGMPLGTVTGLDQTLAIGGEFAVKLKPENMVFAGLRDIDENERQNAEAIGITLVNIEELRAKGIAQNLEKAAERLSQLCDHIVLSIDLDAFSTDLAPAVGSPVPGGFLLEEILPSLSKIARSYSVPLIDIVEFNPTMPGAEQTFELIIRILKELR